MEIIAYMLTWTTYGSWLQGDRRGWVKDGRVCRANSALEHSNRERMKASPVVLTKSQRISAAGAIMDEATKLKQQIHALAVCDNHVHLVVQSIDLSIGRVVSHYKNAVRLVLQEEGFHGKLWTKGFDKRYCVKDNEIIAKIGYVKNHKRTDAEIIVSPPIHSAGSGNMHKLRKE